MKSYKVGVCKCQGACYELRICDPDSFRVPDEAIEVSEYFIARSVYAMPSFSEILLPYYKMTNGAIYCLPERIRFWLLFDTVADAISFKLTYL